MKRPSAKSSLGLTCRILSTCTHPKLTVESSPIKDPKGVIEINLITRLQLTLNTQCNHLTCCIQVNIWTCLPRDTNQCLLCTFNNLCPNILQATCLVHLHRSRLINIQ